MPASLLRSARPAGWTGQHQGPFKRQSWIPHGLLAASSWPRRPAQLHLARLQTSPTASNGGQGSTPKVQSQPPAEALPFSQQPGQWEQARQRVMAFQQQHGRLPRQNGGDPCPLVPGERPLGRWCTEQQRRKAGSKGPPLTAQEQADLAAIPGWVWWARQGVQAGWEQRLQQLEGFTRRQGRLPRQRGGNANPLLPDERELGVWVGNQRMRYKGQAQPQLSTEQIAALERVPGWTWGDIVRQPWDVWCQQVAEFVHQHGRLPTDMAGKPLLPAERGLAVWCNAQRQRWKGNPHYGPHLTVEQQAALEALPGWWWDKRSPWEVQCQRVAAFVERHGRLPRSWGSKGAPLVTDEEELGAWCDNQRQRSRGNIQPALMAEQQSALAAVPGWAWNVRHGWEERREQLEAFVRQHGRLPRRQGSKREPLVSEEKELGAWCDNQRQRRNGNAQPPLTAEQQAALAAVPGWAWGIRRDSWEQRREQVEAFVRQHGRLPRQQGSKGAPLVAQEKVLGTWCNAQRQRWKGSIQPVLTTEQQAALEHLPGWWWEKRSPWEVQCQRVAAFVEKHGRLPRPRGSQGTPLVTDEKELGSWCENQRQGQVGNVQPPLTAKQQAALAAIPGWAWGSRRDSWEKRREQLETFVRHHGRLPRQQGSKRAALVSSEKELGTWCSAQRQRWSGSIQPPLTAEQQRALVAIPGWAWTVTHDWGQRREQLEAFVRGHGRMPRLRSTPQEPLLKGERQLAHWRQKQKGRRKGYRGFAPLSAQQVAALDAIPGWDV